MAADRETRNNTLHEVFAGVHAEDYERVKNALKDLEKAAGVEAHLRGFFLGIVLGVVVALGFVWAIARFGPT